MIGTIVTSATDQCRAVQGGRCSAVQCVMIKELIT